jgi:hypothetical protein
MVALPILSLAPQGQIERTGLGGHAEHVLAYAGAAIAVALAYADRGLVRVLFVLLAYGGLLEFLQRFSPGRVSSLDDFAFSATGVLLGMATLLLSRRLLSMGDRLLDAPGAPALSPSRQIALQRATGMAPADLGAERPGPKLEPPPTGGKC